MTDTIPPLNDRRASSVLAALCACTALVIGFVAAINLAVPMIAASALHPSSSELLWIVDGYVVVFACLVIPAGAAGDRFGRKGVLLAGLAALAAGAAVSALAPTVAIMLAGRVLTGVGAALVLPNTMGVLVHTMPPARRGRAIATWAGMSGIGGVIGNVGGGLLMTTGDWRLLFVAVALIAAGCATWVAVAVPRTGRHSRALDPAGTVTFVAAIVALLAGIIEGPESGWASPLVLGCFAAAAALLVVWVLIERRVAHPMLDPRIFRSPLLSAASVGMLVAFFANFGLFYVNASLLQYGRGFTVLEAGLGVVPLVVPVLAGVRFVPRLVSRIGRSAVLALAFLATSGGLLGLSTAIAQPYAVYACWLVVVGIGVTLALPTLTAEITDGLPAEQAGVAGGLQSATRELGSALGVAVVGTILTAVFSGALPASLRGPDGPHTVAEALATAPAQRPEIVHAFTDGAASALLITSLIAFAAGLVVVAGSAWAARHTH